MPPSSLDYIGLMLILIGILYLLRDWWGIEWFNKYLKPFLEKSEYQHLIFRFLVIYQDWDDFYSLEMDMLPY